VVIALGAYYLATRNTAGKSSTASVATTTSQSTVTATSTANTTSNANWKVYSNTNLNFSIEYPSNWVVTDLTSTSENPKIVLQTPEHSQYVRNNPNTGELGQYYDIVLSVPAHSMDYYQTGSQ